MKRLPVPTAPAVATRRKSRYIPTLQGGRGLTMIIDRAVADGRDPVSGAIARLKRSAGVYYKVATLCAQGA